ncbi:MAG: hypothetical protein P4L36_20865 [Holophaga sp.]|nr:hypothetical protein [Holophaga sp.]
MLVYVFVYVLASVLIFQGVNLLVERNAPAKVVPPEVRPAEVPASYWGRFLVFYGALLAVVAIISHSHPQLFRALVPMRNLGLAFLAVYGLWLVFGRKVDYSPAPPSQEAHGHSH